MAHATCNGVRLFLRRRSRQANISAPHHCRIEDADTLASFAKQIMIMKESLARTASTDVTV